jgi:hypothetical protein
MKRIQLLVALMFASSVASAKTPSLPMSDLEGTWRLSAVSTAKYGCDIPGAMTVQFVKDPRGGVIGRYTGPGMPGEAQQRYVQVANFGTILMEQDAQGRAITLDAAGALRRIFAVETAKGPDGKPSRLEWASVFGEIGDESSPFDLFVPSAWLTRC